MIRRVDKDVASGFLFAALGALGLLLSSSLTQGTMARMGAGYFPTVMSMALMALGLFILILGWSRGAGAIAPMHLRPLGMSVAAILTFTSIETVGLFAALTGVIVLGALASKETRTGEVVALVVGLNIFCWLVFVKGLGMAIPVLPAGI